MSFVICSFLKAFYCVNEKRNLFAPAMRLKVLINALKKTNEIYIIYIIWIHYGYIKIKLMTIKSCFFPSAVKLMNS